MKEIKRSRIEDELRISRTLEPRARAHLNLLRTHDHVTRHFNAVFRDHGLSDPQYNVLRILRGAGNDGLPCQAIGERMIARVPDVTRLLDRLEDAKFVSRNRSSNDRRVVVTRILKRGLDVLESVDPPLTTTSRAQYGHLSDEELNTLSELLEKLREDERSKS